MHRLSGDLHFLSVVAQATHERRPRPLDKDITLVRLTLRGKIPQQQPAQGRLSYIAIVLEHATAPWLALCVVLFASVRSIAGSVSTGHVRVH